MTDIAATLAERGKRYGEFPDHATVTQQLKRVMYGFNPALRLADDQKEALDMIAHKLGRIINGDPDYADSWVDIAGYAKLVADRLSAAEREEETPCEVCGEVHSEEAVALEKFVRDMEAKGIKVVFLDEESGDL